MNKICTNNRINRSLSLKIDTKELGKDIEFETIVKFLNAQKAVMDYAGLN